MTFRPSLRQKVKAFLLELVDDSIIEILLWAGLAILGIAVLLIAILIGKVTG